MGTALVAGLMTVATGSVASAPALGSVTSAQGSAAVDVRVGGWAENVRPLPGDDVLMSNLGKGLVQRVAPTGEISTVAKIAAPGGMALNGSTLYVVTGNSPVSAVTRDGGVLAVDLTTGATRSVVGGLGEANGLDRLPDGDLVLTVTLGAGAGVQRLDPVTGELRLLTTSIPSPNGLAVGPDGQAYVGSTLLGTISRVDPDTGRTTRVAGTSAVIDDFDVRPDGRIIAFTQLGFVDELDPATGRSRPVAWGCPGGTSIKLRPGGGAVLSTVTGRVVSLDL